MRIPETLLLRFFEANFDVKKTTDSSEIRIDSIYTNDTKKKLYISLSKNVFICFKTGTSGSVNKFLQDHLGLTNGDVLTHLVANYGGNDFTQEDIIEENNKNENIDFIYGETTWFRDISKIGIYGKKALNYLKGRHIPEKYINKWGYVFNSNSEYNERIIIPFFENERIVYFQGRSINKDDKLRYKNPHLDSKEFLFNYDDISDDKPLAIVEGVFDAASIDNIPATAMMSQTISVRQINKIAEKGVREIIYIADKDDTGMANVENNINMIYFYYPPSLDLKMFIYNIPGKYKDFNEYAIGENTNQLYLNDVKEYKKNTFPKLKVKFKQKLI